LARASAHWSSPSWPERRTRTWVIPWLDVRWVSTGTFSLQMYFTDFTEIREWGNTT
jgi:hypothetical protein